MTTVKFTDETIDERRTVLRNLLTEGVYTVTFNKVNGETRAMPCTLKSDLLPAQQFVGDKPERKENVENLSVWCTDKDGWRSFKLANVVEIAPIQP